jgi:5-methylcytosine-specific restriction endonuclease McrA
MHTMRPRKWTENQLREAAKDARSYRQILQRLNLKMAGGNYMQIKHYIKYFEIPINLKGRGWNKGQRGEYRPLFPLSIILTKNSRFQSYKLKNRLFREGIKSKKCEECGWAVISPDGRLPLELDHINGDSTDNRLENLRILCPNCHSLKPTHRGLNKNKRSPAQVAEWYTLDT